MPADNMKSSIQNTHVYNHSKLYPAKIVGLVVIIFMVIIYGFVIQGSVSRFDNLFWEMLATNNIDVGDRIILWSWNI